MHFLRIHHDARGFVADKVTQYAQAEIQVLIQNRQRCRRLGQCLYARPDFAQVRQIRSEFRFRSRFGHGADDVSALFAGGQQALQFFTQMRAIFLVFNTLRDANVGVILRQINEKTPGDADLCGETRALGADRVFHHLHHQVLPFGQQPFNRRTAGGAMVPAALFAAPDIRHVQKSCSITGDINERRLHARQHAYHLAHIDIAHQPARRVALDVQLLHHAAFDNRDAGFLRRDVDEYFFAHFVEAVIREM